MQDKYSTYPQEVKVVQGVRTGLGTAQGDYDKTYQGDDRKHIRREDPRNSSGLAHDG